MIRLYIPRFRSSHHLSILLIIIWLLTFIYHERFVPYYASKRCDWPKLANKASPVIDKNDQSKDSIPTEGVTNILLIADPQLIDNHTYPGRNELLLKLSKHTVDTYLKRNYNSLVSQLRPDYIFFLGDYLDNGRSSTDEYFKREFRRFNGIFTKKGYKKDKNFFINLPGNHDVGWANGVKLPSRARFSKNFGNPNSIETINNVDFISIDTLSLSSSANEIYQEARSFLDTKFGETDVKTKPRILLTHVPLYRDVEKCKCGPLRENPVFHLGGGYQYKSALESDLSTELLSKVKPDLIFSGDDHDYCDINHQEIENQHSREITVKSISMAMGIRYPGVQLLSFVNRDNNDDYRLNNNFRYETKLCYIQTPYINIINYAILAVVSGLLILWWNLKQRPSRHNYSVLPMINASFSNLSNSSSFSSSNHPVDPISSSTSKKLSNFLKEQDEDKSKNYFISLPKYTFTSSSSSSRVSNKLRSIKVKIDDLMKKWGLFGFLKHSIFLSIFVILLYYVGFCLTL